MNGEELVGVEDLDVPEPSVVQVLTDKDSVLIAIMTDGTAHVQIDFDTDLQDTIRFYGMMTRVMLSEQVLTYKLIEYGSETLYEFKGLLPDTLLYDETSGVLQMRFRRLLTSRLNNPIIEWSCGIEWAKEGEAQESFDYLYSVYRELRDPLYYWDKFMRREMETRTQQIISQLMIR